MTHPTVTFDAATHRYTLPHGQRVPSVTEILKATGISTNFDDLAETLGASAAADIDAKRELGSVVHGDAHAYDDDDLDWDTVDPRVAPYLEAWAAFRANQQLEPLTRERLVYHAGLGYAGTLDGLFRRPNRRQVLVDIKLGDPEDAGGAYQTAAYQLAFTAEHPDAVIHERLCVWLRPDLAVPYRTYPYDDWRDLQKWAAIVTTFYCGQAARRLR